MDPVYFSEVGDPLDFDYAPLSRCARNRGLYENTTTYVANDYFPVRGIYNASDYPITIDDVGVDLQAGESLMLVADEQGNWQVIA